MAWNILWHQAIIHSRLIGVTEKKGKTIAFDIPVRVDGTAVRILMENRKLITVDEEEIFSHIREIQQRVVH